MEFIVPQHKNLQLSKSSQKIGESVMYAVATDIKQFQIFTIGDRWWDFSLQLIAIEINVSQGTRFWKCLGDSSIEIIHS